ncbi:hypothetical protein MTR67_000702 [Solanum verrucosum]|uniref:Chromo domain-containing protein n=1 Tax=Solanum verrucosum TaxID=315347 RepID=A0AAF0PM98_SOLVR|nr:hypothetical protein MTR67_000702 [Solanum verrucosum]
MLTQKELNLRQRRWLELLKDYDLSILYHPVVHPVFHISILKKCIGDPLLILLTESIRIKDSLSYEEILVQILDRQVRRLRTKDVASVKVLWRNQLVDEATWEAEEDIKKRYPYLFQSGGNADQGTNFFLSAL